MRYTPENITKLQPNEVFVFGSNLKGQHGGGAAKLARSWGAKWGKGVGRSGQTYAIPTKKDYIKTLPVEEIEPFISQFLFYAKDNPEFTFIVTKIGCGLAGHSIESIAPLFKSAIDIPNIILPIEFTTT